MRRKGTQAWHGKWYAKLFSIQCGSCWSEQSIHPLVPARQRLPGSACLPACPVWLCCRQCCASEGNRGASCRCLLLVRPSQAAVKRVNSAMLLFDHLVIPAPTALASSSLLCLRRCHSPWQGQRDGWNVGLAIHNSSPKPPSGALVCQVWTGASRALPLLWPAGGVFGRGGASAQEHRPFCGRPSPNVTIAPR